MIITNFYKVIGKYSNNVKARIITFACLTRLIAILLQVVSNLIIPDHEADAFKYPKSETTVHSIYDDWVTFLFGGFLRWDAHYFMHIAKYGYSYEQVLAFFPLYPLLVKALSSVFAYIFVFLNEESLLLLTFVSLNCFLFIKSVITLYELTLSMLDSNLAYKTAILFCINPATIFFIAPYTECLYSYLTFVYMKNCYLKYERTFNIFDFESCLKVIIPLGLSIATRSNGILNIGFISYFIIQAIFKNISITKSKMIICLKLITILLLIIFVSLIPFFLFQLYAYYLYCTEFPSNLSGNVFSYGLTNKFVLPGKVPAQTWCHQKLPLAYSYIQNHYWEVGFLKYFQLKQIPNFILAAPVIYIIVTNSIKFAKQHKKYCLNLGIFKCKANKFREKTKDGFLKKELFVFVVHAFVLVVFCTFCIHVQVTTRMICSASPVLYWFAAYYFEPVKEENNKLRNMFLWSPNKNRYSRYIVYYFLSYCVIGNIMFTNFLPWT